MPSDRRQINVRVDEQTEALLGRLIVEAGRRTGLDVSQSDVFRLALQALAREYAQAASTEPPFDASRPPGPPPAPKSRRRKRSS